MPAIPSPDDVILGALRLAGFPIVVLTLVGSTFALLSWYTGIKASYKLGRKAKDTFVQARATLPGTNRYGVAVAATVSILAALAQAGLIVSAYVVGNLMSIMLGLWPSFDDVPRLGSDPLGAMVDGELWPHLTLDPVAGIYVAVVVAAILASYFWFNSRAGLAFLISSPGLLLVAFGGIFAFLFGIFSLFVLLGELFMASVGQDNRFANVLDMLGNTIYFGAMALVGLTYWLACRGALQCSAETVDIWRASTSRQNS